MSKVRESITLLKQNNRLPTLTIKGFIFHCTNEITNVVEQRFDRENAFVDAAIISAVTTTHPNIKRGKHRV